MARLAVAAALAVVIFASSAAAVTHTVVWQFQRPSGQKLFGQALQDDLTPKQIALGDSLLFTWDEGSAHEVYKVDTQAEFDGCVLTGTKLQSAVATGSVLVEDLPLGTHFFFDSFLRNCADLSLKMAIEVLEPGFTTEAPVTTPPGGVTEAPKSPETATEITWHYGIVQDDITVEADDFLRFIWDDRGILHTLREVDEAAYLACDTGASGIDHSGAVALGDVVLTDFSVGPHYFICRLPTHCSGGNMKIKVNVVPAKTLFWVTLWGAEGTGATSDAVYISLIGYDDEKRVWTSPETQINRRASSTDPSGFETLSLSGTDPGFFEAQLRNVGTITAIRIRSASAGWTAGAVKVQLASQEAQSETFSCSGVFESSSGETLEQYCVMTEPRVFTSFENTASPNTNSSQEECGCFREFLMQPSEEKVHACSADGCFSTLDSGDGGWSDLTGVSHLLGLDSEGLVYARSSTNATLVSADGGVTWQVTIEMPSLVEDALDFTFDVANLTSIPLDEHVYRSADQTVLWGPSSQGIHVNKAGSWDLHSLWSCSCDGQCGLKCNQPSPNLL